MGGTSYSPEGSPDGELSSALIDAYDTRWIVIVRLIKDIKGLKKEDRERYRASGLTYCTKCSSIIC